MTCLFIARVLNREELEKERKEEAESDKLSEIMDRIDGLRDILVQT